MKKEVNKLRDERRGPSKKIGQQNLLLHTLGLSTPPKKPSSGQCSSEPAGDGKQISQQSFSNGAFSLSKSNF